MPTMPLPCRYSICFWGNQSDIKKGQKKDTKNTIMIMMMMIIIIIITTTTTTTTTTTAATTIIIGKSGGVFQLQIRTFLVQVLLMVSAKL